MLQWEYREIITPVFRTKLWGSSTQVPFHLKKGISYLQTDKKEKKETERPKLGNKLDKSALAIG